MKGGEVGGSQLFATPLIGFVFHSVSLTPLDEAVIQPIRGAPQVAERAESGSLFWPTPVHMLHVHGKRKEKKERRHANLHRKESKSDE